ncbi:hypothetical protein BSF44_49590 [Pseudomonas sp. ACN8]|uniref:hypothetical protein n=1 Tax=Pseudomonas sp. ACN8 TaxID=1920428 RepID=UPI000BB38995|nr:hypothetical protein [Pseudomonas sp. ACN8]PBJ18776.1 hypothetical protein BSF44_49590 [Pseudomonas sp. ACN8]
MPELKNFVATDHRSGPDRIYFFFKDTNTYSRFNLGDNKVADNHPASVVSHWDDFDQHVKDLRFGFNTSGRNWNLEFESDMTWFFYYDGNKPMVCKYDQHNDKVKFKKNISETDWSPLLPYFDKIIGVMWDEKAEIKHTFHILLNDGNYFIYNPWLKKASKLNPFKGSMWSKLEQYKDRMITTVLNDHPLLDTFFYIFLTKNEYLRFDVNKRSISDPIAIDEESWPGLIVK